MDQGRAAARITGGKRDSGATLVTPMHSASEGRPKRKQHLEGVYCASKRCGGGVRSVLGAGWNCRRRSGS